MSEDEKNGTALKTVAALAAIATPPAEPGPHPETAGMLQRIAELSADRERITALHGDKVKKLGEIAADRDKWKLRAEKAEAASDGLALERATKERDGLRTEVSKLTKRITESDKEKDAEIAQLKATLKTSMADANEAASQAERLRTTMEQAIKARDRAFADRDAASEERVEAVKRGTLLEEQVKKLKEELKAAMPVKSGAGAPIPAGAKK